MSRNKILFSLFLLIAISVYYLFFYQNKTLKYLPENADVVVLIDVKKLAREAVFNFATNPSRWFEKSENKDDLFSLRNSGVKIPDFVQIFHLKNSQISEWYSVLEINNQEEFSTFLKEKKFSVKGEKIFQKNQLYLKIIGDKCLVGTSQKGFSYLEKNFIKENTKNYRESNEFIHNTIASISTVSAEKIKTFDVEMYEEEIVIKNVADSKIFAPLLKKLEQNQQFLDLELDAKNAKKFAHLFNKKFSDSAQIKKLKAIATLEEVNDTIITYGYDDNFNEIEKKTFQKIVQPNYSVSLASENTEDSWQYFKNKNWINAENQFTVIPFQPNIVSHSKNEILIESLRKPLQITKSQNENYFFLKNSKLIYASFKSITENEKNFISKIDYIFYGNKVEHYYMKIKFRKGELPSFF